MYTSNAGSGKNQCCSSSAAAAAAAAVAAAAIKHKCSRQQAGTQAITAQPKASVRPSHTAAHRDGTLASFPNITSHVLWAGPRKPRRKMWLSEWRKMFWCPNESGEHPGPVTHVHLLRSSEIKTAVYVDLDDWLRFKKTKRKRDFLSFPPLLRGLTREISHASQLADISALWRR